MAVDAILPAGGRISGGFARVAGTDIKALINFGGKSVAERTVECLCEAGVDGRMVLVGPEELKADAAGRMVDNLVLEVGSGPENILAGLRCLEDMGQVDRVLIVNTDLPFLTPESVRRFLAACPDSLDICAPVISREDFERCYPGLHIRFVRLKDGFYTIGCLFLVRHCAISDNRETVDRVFRARKSQLLMASLLGFGFVIQFLLHRLSVSDIERRCASILGCSAGAVFISDANLAFDLDSQIQYEYACQYFAGGRSCGRK